MRTGHDSLSASCFPTFTMMKKFIAALFLVIFTMPAFAYTWSTPGEKTRMTWFDTCAPDYYMRVVQQGTVANPSSALQNLKLTPTENPDSTTMVTFREDGDGTFLTVARSENNIMMYGCSEANNGQRLLIKSKGTLPSNQKPTKGWLHIAGIDETGDACYLLITSSTGRYYILDLIEAEYYGKP